MSMDFNTYERLFREKAIDAGYSEANILKCLRYAHILIDRKLPVIYNSSNFAALVGYKRSYIKRAINHPRFFYRHFSIKKKNGKSRNISEPLPSLKEIQTWILNNILYVRKTSRFAKAYVSKRNIVDNVKFHLNQPKVVCIDIKDFFSSIKEEYITVIFIEFGYSRRVSETLSKLCCLDGCLPQGAPTSPYLSNIYMHNFDTYISKYCTENKIRYTRYADDITFSGDFDEKIILSLVNDKLLEIGLLLNGSKTRIMTQNNRQLITGIVVNEKLQVPKEKRKELRQSVYYIKKFGLSNHLKKIGCTKNNYLKHLLGLVNYTLFINPHDKEAIEQKDFLFQLLKNGEDFPLPF